MLLFNNMKSKCGFFDTATFVVMVDVLLLTHQKLDPPETAVFIMQSLQSLTTNSWPPLNRMTSKAVGCTSNYLGIIWHFGKDTYLLSGVELDQHHSHICPEATANDSRLT